MSVRYGLQRAACLSQQHFISPGQFSSDPHCSTQIANAPGLLSSTAGQLPTFSKPRMGDDSDEDVETAVQAGQQDWVVQHFWLPGQDSSP
ncbi:hypothetical protein BV898_16052 [Hypsibius exemplaris]|uniref:Uncharacterized protein n=1 Tax=Hypsibius exemplaris TaxID=2072580 RepID=A0A9X6RL46_HYPEX|nr:hypothetical protein BV898_16052 [Hypsibius exemplaris]